MGYGVLVSLTQINKSVTCMLGVEQPKAFLGGSYFCYISDQAVSMQQVNCKMTELLSKMASVSPHYRSCSII